MAVNLGVLYEYLEALGPYFCPSAVISVESFHSLPASKNKKNFNKINCYGHSQYASCIFMLPRKPTYLKQSKAVIAVDVMDLGYQVLHDNRGWNMVHMDGHTSWFGISNMPTFVFVDKRNTLSSDFGGSANPFFSYIGSLP